VRALVFAFSLCFLFFCASSLGQSTQSTANESQGIQALVAEVRQLRKDLQATNAYALKAQILLNRLQLQEGIVAHASEHLNEVRGRLGDAQRHRTDIASALKRLEESPDSTEISPADQKQIQNEISRLKRELENVALEEQQRQAAETEAEEQLRTEQAKLDGLEERVDGLEKDLGSNPH
jgi:chromosome segregation ATPase